jgi:hypothetical protein
MLFLFSISMFLLFFCLNLFFNIKNKNKKLGEKMQIFFYFFFLLIAFQILHVCLPDISVHCALSKAPLRYIFFFYSLIFSF